MSILTLDRYMPIVRRMRRPTAPPALTLDTWNLVRGGTRTYDVAAQEGVGARTGWGLENPPANLTISAAGVITATLNHLHTATPGTLEVSTNEGNIRVPTTIRDWNLSDSGLPIVNGASLWKSRDGAANTELFRLDILDPLTANYPTALESDIIMVTGANGELDISTLEDAFASHSNGVAVVTKLTNIGTSSPGDLDQLTGGYCAYAWKENGGAINYFTTPSGVRSMRSEFKPSDFNTEWSDTEYQAVRYRTAYGQGASIGNFWAMTCVMRRRDQTSTPHWEAGDQNLYPDILENRSQGNRYTVTGNFNAGSVSINDNSGLDWVAVQGGIYPQSVSLQTPMMRLRLASLERDDRAQRNDNTPSNLHGFGGGYGIRLRRYDFTDVYVHDLPNNFSATEEHFDDLSELETYFAAKIANQNLYAA